METVGIEYSFLVDKAIKSAKALSGVFTGIEKSEESLKKGNQSLTNSFINVASNGLNFLKNKAKESYQNYQNNAKNSSKETMTLGEQISVLGNKIGNIKQAGISAFQMAKGFVMANIATNALNSALQTIPAFGQVLGQAKNVIMNNLFYPLNQAVLPVLRDIMKWVRENRVVFVQLGQVLANIFKLVVHTVKTVFSVLKSVFDSVFQTVFGKTKDTFKSFMDVLNLATLKIAFVVTFLAMLLKPVLMGIATAFNWVYENGVKPFFSGFFQGFNEKLFPVVLELERLLNNLLAPFQALSGEGEAVKNVMYQLGYIISTSLMEGLRMTLNLINNTIDKFKEWKDLTLSLAFGGIAVLAAMIGKALVGALMGATSAVIGFTIALLANPLTWVALSVVALSYVLIKLYNNWDLIKQSFKDMSLSKGIDYLSEKFRGLKTQIGNVWNWLKTSIDSIMDRFYQLGQSIATSFNSSINRIKKGFTQLGQSIVISFNSSINRIKKVFTQLGQFITTLFNSTINNIKKGFSQLGQSIGNSFSSGLNYLSDKLNSFKSIVSSSISSIKDRFNSVKDSIVQFGKSIKDWIVDKFQNAVNLASSIGNLIKDSFVSGISTIKSKFSSLSNSVIEFGNTVKQWIVGKFEEALQIIQKVGGVIKGFFNGENEKKISIQSTNKNDMNKPVIPTTENVPKVRPELLNQSTNKNDMNFEDNKKLTFNITGTDPKETAEEVARIIQKEDSLRKKFNDSAFAKGKK